MKAVRKRLSAIWERGHRYSVSIPLLFALALAAGMLGGAVGTRGSFMAPLIAILGAFGSVLAATATYSTVKEVKAGRIVQTRGLLYPVIGDGSARHRLRMPRGVPIDLSGSIPVIVTNGGLGPAMNIHTNWISELTPDDGDIQLLNRALAPIEFSMPAPYRVDIAFAGRGRSFHVQPTSLHYGQALGASANYSVNIPSGIMNLALLLNLCRIARVLEGADPVQERFPKFRIMYRHESAYEKQILNEYSFEVHAQVDFHRTGLNVSLVEGRQGWDGLSIVQSIAFTSDEIDALPRVAFDAPAQRQGIALERVDQNR